MKEDTTTIDPTWMEKTGGYARDMTLHDWYFGLAMQGLLASGVEIDDDDDDEVWAGPDGDMYRGFIATTAYQQATLMIVMRGWKNRDRENAILKARDAE
jgi:hypothetical protein